MSLDTLLNKIRNATDLPSQFRFVITGITKYSKHLTKIRESIADSNLRDVPSLHRLANQVRTSGEITALYYLAENHGIKVSKLPVDVSAIGEDGNALYEHYYALELFESSFPTITSMGVAIHKLIPDPYNIHYLLRAYKAGHKFVKQMVLDALNGFNDKQIKTLAGKIIYTETDDFAEVLEIWFTEIILNRLPDYHSQEEFLTILHNGRYGEELATWATTQWEILKSSK